MRTATTIEGSAGRETAEFAVEAEKLGLDVCWVAEAWGADAPSLLGYLAARTESMLLGSGVIQVGTRSPVTIAQTAMTLAHLSGGRFLLGLGVSGPQVIEGLHGIPFGHPLARMRETVAIVRSVFTGEKVSFAGTQYQIPLPSARPMRVSLPPTSVPVYLASLSPRMLELTGEIADGWLGTSFVPEGASAYFTHLDAGLARAGRRRADLDICQGAEINLVDEADLARTVASRKKELAFSLGGMGSGTSNFYNDAYSRQGWADVAAQVRARWQAGDRDGAAGLVTDEMVLATTLIGTEDMVRARLRTWRDAGVDTVRLYPAGDTLAARLDNLGRGIDLVRSLRPAGSFLSRTDQGPVARPWISRVSAGSSLTCRYMLNPVMLSSRLTMGWQPVMISSRPCLAWISWAQASTDRLEQSAKPSADRSATRVFGARSRALRMACRRWFVPQTSSSPWSRSRDHWS